MGRSVDNQRIVSLYKSFLIRLKYIFGVGDAKIFIIFSKNPISLPVRSSAALVPNNSGNVCNNKFSYAVKNFFQYCDFGSSVVVFFRCAIYCLTYLKKMWGGSHIP